LVRVNQPTFGHISIRRPEGFLKRRTVGLAQPIAGIESKELHFSAFRQLGGLIEDQAAIVDACCDSHDHEIITTRFAQQGIAEDAGTVPLSRRR